MREYDDLGRNDDPVVIGEAQSGHSVCVSCGKGWDVVCYKCHRTFCYDCVDSAKKEVWICDKCSRDKCTCEEFEWEPHPCPFQEDVWDNHDPEYCTCCPYCTQQCAWDI